MLVLIDFVAVEPEHPRTELDESVLGIRYG